jgi:hypothetical protein
MIKASVKNVNLRGASYESFEFGIGNAECGIEIGLKSDFYIFDNAHILTCMLRF